MYMNYLHSNLDFSIATTDVFGYTLIHHAKRSLAQFSNKLDFVPTHFPIICYVNCKNTKILLYIFVDISITWPIWSCINELKCPCKPTLLNLNFQQATNVHKIVCTNLNVIQYFQIILTICWRNISWIHRDCGHIRILCKPRIMNGKHVWFSFTLQKYTNYACITASIYLIKSAFHNMWLWSTISANQC